MKKCKHVPYKYVTKHYLMCAQCKKKIRMLRPDDIQMLTYIEALEKAKDTVEKNFILSQSPYKFKLVEDLININKKK